MSEEFQSASDACNDFLVAFKPAADPALATEQTEAAIRFAVCMREHGLDWPDPAPDGAKVRRLRHQDRQGSAGFQAAYEVCDDELAVEDESGAGT